MQTATSKTQDTTTTRTSSWRHELAARYEIQQARLRVAIEDSDDAGEYL